MCALNRQLPALCLAAFTAAGAAASPQEDCLRGIAPLFDDKAVYVTSKAVVLPGDVAAVYEVPRIERFSSKAPKLAQPAATSLMLISGRMSFISMHHLTQYEVAGPEKKVDESNLNEIGLLTSPNPDTKTFPDMVYQRNDNPRWAKFSLAFLNCLQLER